MKKTYIVPKAKSYNVNARCENYISTSLHNEYNDKDETYTKGQLENESVSIWDLY